MPTTTSSDNLKNFTKFVEYFKLHLYGNYIDLDELVLSTSRSYDPNIMS